MTRRVVLIKHEDSPGDDRAASHLAARGFALDWRYPYLGDALDEPADDVAGTILYGGGQSIPERDRHPFFADEFRWVERCVARNVPTVGICLGAQVVAHTLGAHVGPGADGYHEFGYYPVFATDAGRAYMPDELVVTQAHFHEFSLPAGAVLLARSELFPNQGFRYGETTFALQFHPECTIAGFRRWQDAEWAPWGVPGVQPRDEQDRLAAAHDAAQHVWFTGFLDRLFGPADADA